MFMVHVSEEEWVQTKPTKDYSFGTGDFTIVAMVRMEKAGLLIEYRDYDVKDGYQLGIDENGAIYFDTGLHGEMHYAKSLGGAVRATNQCYVVSVVRRNGFLSIFVNGVAMPLTSGGDTVHFPWNIGVPVPEVFEIGRGRWETSFIGSLMNIGVWARALDPTELQQAGFAVLSVLGENILGYWTLNDTLTDSSWHDNSVELKGHARFKECFGCVWSVGDHGFRFLQVKRQANPISDAETLFTVKEDFPLDVASGAKAMFVSLMQSENGPFEPSPGTDLVIIDPKGRNFNKTQDSDHVFIFPGGGVANAVVVIDPMPGKWQFRLSSRSDQPAFLQVQVIPSHDIVPATLSALRPFYNPTGTDAGDQTFDLSWGLLWDIAVTASTGVVIAGAIVAGSEVAVPVALVTGVVLLMAAPTVVQAADVVRGTEPNVVEARYKMASCSGFVVAQDHALFIDGGADGDFSERIIYEQRRDNLNPFVEYSSFKDNSTFCTGSSLTQEKISQELIRQVGGYVTASGHGIPTALLATATGGVHPPLIDEETVTHKEVFDKIFHFLACWTGADQPHGMGPGLGETLVKRGAKAFFGYKDKFIIPKDSTPNVRFLFCEPDIEIDKALLQGKTCDEAYKIARQKYLSNIKLLEQNGQSAFAEAMKRNFTLLVAPSTNTKFGKKEAKLESGT